jgi:hypothetical protein
LACCCTNWSGCTAIGRRPRRCWRVSTYAVAPRARRDRALDLLLLLGGVLAGASARLIYEYVSRF